MILPTAPEGRASTLSDSIDYYDSLGRVSSEVDGNANTRAYTYDALDRTKTITYSHSGQASSTITYNYDNDGNVSSMVDNTGTTTYAYDALNRLKTETRPGGGSTSYAYDKGSNLTAVTDGAGTTSYLYDSTDLLTRITEPGGKQLSFGYDANGNRTSITYPGSVVGTIGYDASNRIRTLSWVRAGTTTLASFTYSYTDPSTGKDTDLRQSVTSLLWGDAQSTTTTYGYDYFARLTSASSTGGSTNSYAYAYDLNGNRTRQTINGSSTNYLYNAANELCWSGAADPAGYDCVNQPAGGRSYSYDSNGNMLTGSSNSFAYNSKNQTSSVTPNGGSAITMTYTGPGQARRTATGSTPYVNDVLGVASENSTYYTRDASGTVLGERNPVGGSGSYYFLFDGLGSIVAVCDATGVVKDTFKYDPFGGATTTNAPIANPWRFVGGYLDSATSLYKFGERYYDASLTRWTQLDTVDSPLDTHGWNRYMYAGDDPVNFVDPTGRFVGPKTVNCFASGFVHTSRSVDSPVGSVYAFGSAYCPWKKPRIKLVIGLQVWDNLFQRWRTVARAVDRGRGFAVTSIGWFCGIGTRWRVVMTLREPRYVAQGVSRPPVAC